MLCKYPIRIVFLDDDEDFLKILKQYYSNYYTHAEYYNDSEEFLQMVSKFKSKSLLDIYLGSIDEEHLGQRSFAIDIARLCHEVNREERNQQIGVIVIDQNLPAITGTSILQSLPDGYYFKILLTASTDTNMAIRAFNNGYIDGFITKSDFNMLDELSGLINKGIENYFKKQSEFIIKAIKVDKSRKSALEEKSHQEILDKIIKKFNVVEYYLLDSFGSYLMFDSNRDKHYLLINDTNSISGQIDVLKEFKLHDNIINEIWGGKKMLYWPTGKDTSKITDYIFESDFLDSSRQFTYAVLNHDPFELTSE